MRRDRHPGSHNCGIERSAETRLKLRAVIPSRGDDEGPRYVSGRCKLASVISAVFVRSLACTRDEAHCKRPGVQRKLRERFRSRIP